MSQLPAALASRQRRSIIDDAVTGLGMSRGPHISIKGNRFRLINGAGQEFLVPTQYLDLVVVDASNKTSKIFYEGEYDPAGGDAVPPTCFSDNGTGPSNQAMSPQAPTCTVCPWNKIGSDQSKVTGRGIKACSDRKKLAVIIPDDTAVNIYELQIPPGSLSNLRAYSQWLGQQASGVEGRRLDIADVVTRLEFDPNKMGVLKFAAAAFADDDRTIQLIEHIDANKMADQAVGRNDVAIAPASFGALPAPQPTAAAEQPAQQFTLPPRANPVALPSPTAVQTAAPAPQDPPKRRGRQSQAQALAPAAAPAAAPFAPQQAAPIANGDLGIPAFLRRDNGAAPVGAPPAPPAPRFGVGAAGAPPADVTDALKGVMALPTRR